MSPTTPSWPDHATRPGRDAVLPAFDGYPYLMSRIGRSALRHIALLPIDWSREQVIDLARRQADANRLETAACFGPADAVYVGLDGRPTSAGDTPTGLLVVEQLQLAEWPATTDELRDRRKRCRALAAELHGGGYLVGDGAEGGEAAKPQDRRRLGRRPDGWPSGLRVCTTCGEPAGDYLRGGTEIVRCWCACENHNRCARCRLPLAGHRLSAWFYVPDDGQAFYQAGYGAFSHRCPDEEEPQPYAPGLTRVTVVSQGRN